MTLYSLEADYYVEKIPKLRYRTLSTSVCNILQPSSREGMRTHF